MIYSKVGHQKLNFTSLDDEKPQNLPDRKPPNKNRPNLDKDEEEKQDPVLIIGKQVSAGDNIEDQKSVKVKHIFDINILWLNKFAILKKIIKDINRGDKYSVNRNDVKYIQDVFVKYIFPLDDEQIVSDYIEFSPKEENSIDYKVSMHSYHNYVLEPNKSIINSLIKSDE